MPGARGTDVLDIPGRSGDGITMWTVLLQVAIAGPLPASTRQLVLVVASDPDGSTAVVHLAARDAAGWRMVGGPMPARIGSAGIAWGIGLHPPQDGRQKVEGDLRSPAGLFRVGRAYRDDTVPPLTVAWPVDRVGPRDLWVEDPRSPFYNQHLVVAGDRPLEPWEERARMILGDPVLALKVAVDHNPPPAVAGAGSAIFLHTWGADGAASTAGCTAVARPDLVRVVRWLEPGAEPVFALLTREDLTALAADWGLPRP